MAIIIRAANRDDIKSVLELVHKLAAYEKKNPSDVQLTEEKILAHGFNSQPYFHLLVAESEQKLIGYALYFFTYAASKGAPILYLEDLFVLTEYRNKGIGTQMLSKLAEIAKKDKCCRMEWHAFTWNNSAITFYKSLKGQLKEDLVQVRLEDEAVNELVNYQPKAKL